MARTYNYLVPWSGGLDSTFLIYKLLNEGHVVDALYTNLNGMCQDDRQLKAVTELTEIFKENYPNNFKLLVNTEPANTSLRSDRFLLDQVIFHVFNIMRNVQQYHQAVAMGYVVGDCAISYLPEIRRIYNSYKGIAFSNNLPTLTFPLMKTTKNMIVRDIPQIYKNKVTWCENFEEDDNCGKCTSCKKMLELMPDRFTTVNLIKGSPDNIVPQEDSLIKES